MYIIYSVKKLCSVFNCCSIIILLTFREDLLIFKSEVNKNDCNLLSGDKILL